MARPYGWSSGMLLIGGGMGRDCRYLLLLNHLADGSRALEYQACDATIC